MEAAVREAQLSAAARAFEAEEIPALLGKGWAVARHYAHAGLRPYGDLDFFVPRADVRRARAALSRLHPPLPVDLHDGFAELDDREETALLGRGQTVEVGGVAVKTFGPEDHLRLVALHLLRHGAARCLWLCDVGALLEGAKARFDWDLVLAGSPQRARGVAAVVRMAESLLAARPASARASEPRLAWEEPPRWLEEAVLVQWGRGSAFRHPVGSGPRSPLPLLRSLVSRWPNAVEATAGLEASFDRGPRWPYQVAFAAVRALRFARPLARSRG